MLGIAAHGAKLGHQRFEAPEQGSSTQKVARDRSASYVSKSPLDNARESTNKLVAADTHVYVEGGGC